MKKIVLASVVLAVCGSISLANAASDSIFSVSAELTCKVGKSGKENVVKGGKVCYTEIGSLMPTATCTDTRSQLIQNGAGDPDKTEVLCAAGQALVNSSVVSYCAGGSTDVALLTSILANLAGSVSKTNSLVVGTSIIHQWNFFCSPSLPSAPPA